MKKIAKITTTINNILAIAEEIANRNRAECGYGFASEWQSDCSQMINYYDYRYDELPKGPRNYMIRLIDHNARTLVQNWSVNSDFGYSLKAVWGGELPKPLKGIDDFEVAVSHFAWDNISHFKNARYIAILDVYEEIKICGHRARREGGDLYMITQNGPRWVQEIPEKVFLLPDPSFKKEGWDCERDYRARKELSSNAQRRRTKKQRREYMIDGFGD
jgi:hypothetical protein